ncbi:MAG TPA: BON domain-containing protein [Azospirillum sp.]|nr:BON domain-containing protein [Azospirillum sp.]
MGDDDTRWRGGREVWRDRSRDPDQYSRYGRDEEWEEGRFGPEDYGGGASRGGGDYERGGFRIRGGGRGGRYDYRDVDSGREDFGGYGQGRGFRDYGRDEWRSEDRGRQARRDFGRDYARERARRMREENERGFLERAGDEIASWFGDEDAERRRRQDEARSHRGRGPRGYTRSDERIREDVNDRLTDDPYVDASDVEVTVSACEVTLNGHVPHRSMKRRAEDIAESVSGVTHVQNNLRAGQGSSTTAGASAMAGMGGGADQPTSGTAAAPRGTAKTRT